MARAWGYVSNLDHQANEDESQLSHHNATSLKRIKERTCRSEPEGKEATGGRVLTPASVPQQQRRKREHQFILVRLFVHQITVGYHSARPASATRLDRGALLVHLGDQVPAHAQVLRRAQPARDVRLVPLRD